MSRKLAVEREVIEQNPSLIQPSRGQTLRPLIVQVTLALVRRIEGLAKAVAPQVPLPSLRCSGVSASSCTSWRH